MTTEVTKFVYCKLIP